MKLLRALLRRYALDFDYGVFAHLKVNLNYRWDQFPGIWRCFSELRSSECSLATVD
jgi:hypothetical protein